MIKRTIEISQQSHLALKNKQLVIKQRGDVVGVIPVEDIGELILNDPGITMTQAVMVESQKNNVALILCDEKHLPISTMLPISEGNKLHNKVLRDQINVRTSTKHRLWQNIVKQKINNQSQTLGHFGLPSLALAKMVDKVKSGDPSNIEAQAAKLYWRTLFGSSFRRNAKSDNINSFLNYGYAIVRASVARGIVTTGLHPAIGIHHHSQYDGLALADDLMEPFRPWIDRLAMSVLQRGSLTTMNKENKEIILGLLATKVDYLDEKISFLNSIARLCTDVKLALSENRKRLSWPVWT